MRMSAILLAVAPKGESKKTSDHARPGGTPKIPRSIAAAYLLANSVKKVAWLSSLLNQPTAQLPD
jgi:dihydroxyacid dehydratase/phosphogluconate dehydratase